MTESTVEKRTVTAKTFEKGMVLERPGKTAKIIGVSFKGKEFKGYQCLFVTTLADDTVQESQGVLTIRDLEVLPERGGWKLRTAEPAVETVQLDDGLSVDLEVESPSADEDLTATAELIKQLRQQITEADQLIQQQAEQIEQLIESQQSAIDMVAAADARTQEILDGVDELRRAVDLAPAVNAAAPRCEEVKTLHQKMGNQAAREDADRELAAHLNDGWQKFDCSYVSGDMSTYRYVTLTRVITAPQPVALEPLRAYVKPVGPQVTIIPAAEPVALTPEQRKDHYAAIIARTDMPWSQKRELLNNRLMDAGATAYQAATAALTRPTRSIQELIHD